MTQGKNLSLMVVDDEEMNTMILGRRLRKEGYEVLEACDGLDAISKIVSAETRPHLILMDLMMPRLDGWEACKQIKAKYPEIKIIAVSAKVDEEVRSQASGFDGFCSKPVNFKTMLEKVESLLPAKDGAA